MIAQAYAYLVVALISTARHAPISLAPRLDDLALSMIAASRHLPPMPRSTARLGVPYIGRVVCPDCDEITPVFIPQGAVLPKDPIEKVVVDCPLCEGIEAYIL